MRFLNNLTFDVPNIKYSLFAPNVPARTMLFNMGTKKTTLLEQETYNNTVKILDEFHCEKVMVPTRDGEEIPMVIKYDKRYYTEDSPWVLFTEGRNSSRSMTRW